MVVKDGVWDLHDSFCVEAAVQDPFGFARLSVQTVQGVQKPSPQKLSEKISIKDLSSIQALCEISEQYLCSLHQVSAKDLYKRSLGNISVWDFRRDSLERLCQQDLFKGRLGNISTNLYAVSLYKISISVLLAVQVP